MKKYIYGYNIYKNIYKTHDMRQSDNPMKSITKVIEELAMKI